MKIRQIELNNYLFNISDNGELNIYQKVNNNWVLYAKIYPSSIPPIGI